MFSKQPAEVDGQVKDFLFRQEFFDISDHIFPDLPEDEKKEYRRNLKALYFIFKSPLVGRISFKRWKYMIQVGNQIHPFYLKLKRKFGPYL